MHETLEEFTVHPNEEAEVEDRGDDFDLGDFFDRGLLGLYVTSSDPELNAGRSNFIFYGLEAEGSCVEGLAARLDGVWR